MARSSAKQFLVCIDNEGYVVSLEKRKIYVALPDRLAEKHGLTRIIDESGDDYLYPKTLLPADRIAAIGQEGRTGRIMGRRPDNLSPASGS